MKIGLIAMSGVRVCDDELLRLGLTLPGFVERSKTIASLPSLGLLTLAGMTPSKHDVLYIEVPDLSEVDGVPGEFDLVAISTAFDLVYIAKIVLVPLGVILSPRGSGPGKIDHGAHLNGLGP